MGKHVDDLALIKKDYGEDMMHFCRFHFATILEEPMILYHILSSSFAPNKFLFSDLSREEKLYDFKDFVFSFLEEEEIVHTNCSVEELLNSVGYELIECHNNEEVLSFKKYYQDDEELCTFNDSERIDKYHIFFLKKKNIDQIKREDFTNPVREDQYGTSLLCIQFYRGDNAYVSIKSRYNHTVVNPDATYSNNLDKIVPGLIDAFNREYGFNIKKPLYIGFELRNYVDINYKYYKYNYEIDNIYYSPNNIIIDNGKVFEFGDKSRYVFMDYYILDRHEKKLFAYDVEEGEIECFLDFFKQKEGIILKTDVINEKKGKKVIITCVCGDVEIHLDEFGRIIAYKNPYLVECKNGFMYFNETLRSLSLENLEVVGDHFLPYNKCIKDLYLPKLRICGSRFLSNNKSLQIADFPSLEICGEKFLRKNVNISYINFPKLEKCGYMFMENNLRVEEIDMPNLVSTGDSFFFFNSYITKVNLPKLNYCGSSFLSSSEVEELSLPNLIECGSEFLNRNIDLKKLEVPRLKKCGNYFLYYNDSLTELELPALEMAGFNFMYYNECLEILSIPSLRNVGSSILEHNTSLNELLISDEIYSDPDIERLLDIVASGGEKGKEYIKE